MCVDWRIACGEGGNQVCEADEWGWGGRAQALVSVAQESRAKTPLANGHGTVVTDDIAEEEG